jgi:hypothetical protein
MLFVGTYLTKKIKLSINLDFEKKIVERYCIWEVPREFGPCTFLVPPILIKLSFLDSIRTKLSEFDPLS